MISLNVTGAHVGELDYELLQKVVVCLNAYLAESDLPAGEVNVRFTDNNEIRELNQRYAGHDYPTDVLSFSYLEGGATAGELGDIAISLEMAAVQAEGGNTTLPEEVALLLVHGILHVIGYDHATSAEQAHVDELQASIMAAAGVPYRDFKWVS